MKKKNPKTETNCTELEGEFNATHQYNNSGILLHTRSIQRNKKNTKIKLYFKFAGRKNRKKKIEF